MSGSDNFEAMAPPAQDQRPQGQTGTMRDLDAVYDIPVQISAVLGRAWVKPWISTSITGWLRAAKW